MQNCVDNVCLIVYKKLTLVNFALILKIVMELICPIFDIVAVRMKGKGKGDRTSQHHDDCPLQFPSLKPVDHVRLCPRYSAGTAAVMVFARLLCFLLIAVLNLSDILYAAAGIRNVFCSSYQALQDFFPYFERKQFFV